MGEFESNGVQRRLVSTEKRRERLYSFQNTVVYPEHGSRGNPTSELLATKNKGEKVKLLQSWTAENNVTLYLNGNYRSLLAGRKFGAPVSAAKKVSTTKF